MAEAFPYVPEMPITAQPLGGGMADIVQPQQSGGVPPEVQQAMRPPTDAAEYQQRVSGWQAFQDRLRGDPNLQAALLRFGTQLMQPIPHGQSAAGHIGQALNQGANFYQAGTQNAADEARRQEEARLKREELAVRSAESKSRIGLQGAQTDATRTSTSIAEREAPARLRRIEADIRGVDADAQYKGALTQLNQLKRDMEIAYGPAEAEARLRNMNADTLYKEALTGYQRMHERVAQTQLDAGKGWQSSAPKIDDFGNSVSEATNKTTGELRRVETYVPIPLAEAKQRAISEVKAIKDMAGGGSWFGTGKKEMEGLQRFVGQPVKDEAEAVRVLAERYAQGRTVVKTIRADGTVSMSEPGGVTRGTAATPEAGRAAAEAAMRRGEQVSITTPSGSTPPAAPPASTPAAAPGIPLQRLQGLGWKPGTPGRAVIDGQTYDVDARGNTQPMPTSSVVGQPNAAPSAPVSAPTGPQVPQLVTQPATRQSPKEKSAQARATYSQQAGERRDEAILSAFREIVSAGRFTPDEAGLIRDAIATGKLTAGERKVADDMLKQVPGEKPWGVNPRSGFDRNNPPQPTPMQQHQAYLDHISARFHSAMEAKRAGMLGKTFNGGMYTQEDIDRAVNHFGNEILKDYNKRR